MALDIDTSQALRRPGDLLRLVRGVLAADPHDETDWLEWKSTLDLASAHGRVHMARAILAMANRAPERARAFCGGLGYVVVGAEPQHLGGVEGIDSAKLDAGLEPYLGGVRGPQYSIAYVTVDERTVLVLTVEPPANGDPIYTLRKEGPGAACGAVFVRRPGRTERASAADMDALQQRLTAAQRLCGSIEVQITGGSLRWVDVPSTRQELNRWLETRCRQLMAEANADAGGTQRTRSSEDSSSVTALQHNLVEAMRRPAWAMQAPRLADYKQTLEQWRSQVIDEWEANLPGALVAHGLGLVRLEVINHTGVFLDDIDVTVALADSRARAFPDFERWSGPPEPPPLPRRSPSVLSHVSLPIGLLGAEHSLVGVVPTRHGTTVDSQHNTISVWADSMRPGSRTSSDDVLVLLTDRPGPEPLSFDWIATARALSDPLSGTVVAAVDPEPLDALTALVTKPM